MAMKKGASSTTRPCLFVKNVVVIVRVIPRAALAVRQLGF